MRGLIRQGMLALLLAGCAAAPPRPQHAPMPELRLAPATLGRSLALQQRLEFSHGGRRDSVDALLEVDAEALRLLLHRHGQRLVQIEWDGDELREQRATQVPAALAASRILTDLQLVLWPVVALQRALPPGWTLQAEPGLRHLWQGDELVLEIAYEGDSHARLLHRREQYRLNVHSVQP